MAERRTTLKTTESDFDLRAIDMIHFRAQGARILWDKGDEATVYTRLIDPAHPAVLVSGFAALTQDLEPGDFITLETPRGTERFEIVGTVFGAIQPAQAGEASLIMDRVVYRQVWHDNRIDRLSIKLQPDRDAATVRRDFQVVLLAALVAAYVPARQAGKVDVLEALHYE